ncbi:tubby C-terminal domain-like protein [Virgibacillus flavescens]|uniref:tubby C-terminal domain-like protein n=1 Tax=Virgibacillus flavescens TaxID=1611422 RepID=UPI003D33B84E
MYEYRFFNTISTKPATIYDENENGIGTVTKVYEKPVYKILDILLNGRIFVNYKVEGSNGDVVFKSKKDPGLFKRRQYHIHYGARDDESYIHLMDKKNFEIGERTSFEYKGDTYELEKSIGGWAAIKKDGSVIAEWKSSLKVPFKAYFRLIEENHEEDELLFLGLFHTYLHAP